MMPMKTDRPVLDIVDVVDAICFYTREELSLLRVSNMVYVLQSATLSWYMCPLTDVGFKKTNELGVVLETPEKVLISLIVDNWRYATPPRKPEPEIVKRTRIWHRWMAENIRAYNRFSTKQIVDIVENNRTVSKFNNGDIITTMDIWRSQNE